MRARLKLPRLPSIVLRFLRFLHLCPRPSIHSLPPELFLHIISFLHDDHPTLIYLSSTCRSLALLARPTVFKRVIFCGPKKIGKLCALLPEAAEFNARSELTLEGMGVGVGMRGEWIKEVQFGKPNGKYSVQAAWISDAFKVFMHEHSKGAVETVIIWRLREYRRIMLVPETSSPQLSATIGQEAGHFEDPNTNSTQADAIFPSIRTLIFKKCDLSLTGAWDILANVPNLTTLSFDSTPFHTQKLDEDALLYMREQEQRVVGTQTNDEGELVRREVRVNWPKYAKRRRNMGMLSESSPCTADGDRTTEMRIALLALSISFDMLDDRLFLFGFPSSSSSAPTSLRNLQSLEILDPGFHNTQRRNSRKLSRAGRELFRVVMGPSLRILKLTFGLAGGGIDNVDKTLAESALEAWDFQKLAGLREVHLGPLTMTSGSGSNAGGDGPSQPQTRTHVPNSLVMPLLAKILLSVSDLGTTTLPIEVLELSTCFDIQDIRDAVVLQLLADTFRAFFQSQSHHLPHARFEPILLPSLRKLHLFNVFADCIEPKLEDEIMLREWVRDAFPALVGVRTARGVTVEVKMCSQLDWKARLMDPTSVRIVP